MSAGISGTHSEHRDHVNPSPSAQAKFCSEGGVSTSSTGESPFEDPGLLHRDAGSNQACSMDRFPALPCPTGPQGSVSLSVSFLPEFSEPVRGGTRRSPMVAVEPALPLFSSNAETKGLNSHRVRSKSGWGAICQGETTEGRWTSEEAGFHIIYLELLAMFLALQSFLRDKTNVAVLVRSDNCTAITYLNKMGSPLRSHLCQLALEIWKWCFLHRITPPGREGQCSDRLGISESRQQRLATLTIGVRSCPSPGGSLYNRSACEQNKFTTARLLQLEARSTGESSRCLLNFLVTGLSIPFPPPFQLDRESILKDLFRGGRPSLLIAPAWPAQVWYSQLLRMLTGNPILLPVKQDLLLSPDLRPHPLNPENRMYLAAWPVSGKLSRHRDFLNELQSYSCSPGKPMRTQHTIQPGLSGVAGVLEGMLIHFQHL